MRIVLVLLILCVGIIAAEHLTPVSDSQIANAAPEDTYGSSFVLNWLIGVPIAMIGAILAAIQLRHAPSGSRRQMAGAALMAFVIVVAVMLTIHYRLAARVLG